MPIRASEDFSAESLWTRREWDDLLEMVKEKLPTKNSSLTKLSFEMKERHRLSQTKFITTKPALQEMVKEVFKLKSKHVIGNMKTYERRKFTGKGN